MKLKKWLGPICFIFRETVILFSEFLMRKSPSIYEKRAVELVSYTCDYLSRVLDQFNQRQINPQLNGRDIKKILVIKLGRIGDLVWTSPVLTTLRRRFPRASISIVVSSLTKPIVEHNPCVDKIIVYDIWRYVLSEQESTPIRHRMEILRQLLRERFDIVLNLKTSLGFLLFGLLNKGIFIGPDDSGHAVESTLSPLYKLGIYHPDKELSLFASKGDMQFAQKFLSEDGISNGDTLVAIHPGAGWIGRRWSPGNFAIVADELTRIYDARIILFGAPGDVDIVQEVASKMQNQPIIAAGKTSLMQMAALLRRCDLFIGQDTGPTHIAAALKVPIVVIWGPENIRRARPWTDESLYTVVKKDVSCRPCLQVKCERNYECIQSCSPEQVLQAAYLYLAYSRTLKGRDSQGLRCTSRFATSRSTGLPSDEGS